jgi:hypothetical protein
LGGLRYICPTAQMVRSSAILLVFRGDHHELACLEITFVIGHYGSVEVQDSYQARIEEH